MLYQPRGGQAKICGRYADLVGTKKAKLQIFSMVLHIFPKGKFGSFLEKVLQKWIVFHNFRCLYSSKTQKLIKNLDITENTADYSQRS